jgi:hypothetical protein
LRNYPQYWPIRNLRAGKAIRAYIALPDGHEDKPIGYYGLAGSANALDALARCVEGAATAPIVTSAPIPVAVKAKDPMRAETAAVRLALGKDGADELPVSVGHVDLNGDQRPDLIFWSESQDYCGSLGCDSGAILATPTGYSSRVIQLASSFDTMFVLPTVHNGMHDIRYGNASKVFVWDGKQYR